MGVIQVVKRGHCQLSQETANYTTVKLSLIAFFTLSKIQLFIPIETEFQKRKNYNAKG